jgi:serine/threonine protein kinase
MPKADPSLSVAERVDAACDEFEREWRSGRRPKVDDFIDAAPESDRDALRSALLAVETELQAGRGAADTSVSSESVRTGSHHGPGPTVARPSDQMAVPRRVGRFEIRALLGSGAFGRVYRAYDPSLDREVALKVPVGDAVRDLADRDRFLKEARAAATVSHPNVCQIHEVGEHEGQPYIVMALVPGQSLAEVLRARKEPLPERQAAIIVRKLALALEAAHKKGVVHRDLKPANVMFDKERKDLVVMDFGLARRPTTGDARDTQSGVVMGTPAYMSPEQARGDAKDVGPEGDIFSLGIIMYELLTGSRPFCGTAHEVIGQILLTDPEPPSKIRPDVNPVLEGACLKALAKDPANRFASMKEFAAAVDAYLRPPASSTAEAARAVETKPDTENTDGAGLSTDTRKLAEVFEELSVQRKKAQAETEEAVEEAVSRHSTQTKKLALVLGAVVVLAIIAVGAILFFAKKKEEPPVVNNTVKVKLQLKGVDLKDKDLRYTLDGKPITAAELEKEIDLAPGDYELCVYKGEMMVQRFKLKVGGGANPTVEIEELEVPEPKMVPPVVPKVEPKIEDGFVSIFNGKDLDGWEAKTRPEAFAVDPDGNLTARGDTPAGRQHWLLTKKEYSDYILRFEVLFTVAAGANSGIAIRSQPDGPAVRPQRLHVELRNVDRGVPKVGALVYTANDAVEPKNPIGGLGAGEWHKVEIDVRGTQVKVTINGKLVNDVDMTKIDRTLLAKVEKWAEADLDRKKGHIGIQSQRNAVKFRNIRVKELAGAPPAPGGPELAPVPKVPVEPKVTITWPVSPAPIGASEKVKGLAPLHALPHKVLAFDAIFSADGSMIFTVSYAGAPGPTAGVIPWDVKTGRQKGTPPRWSTSARSPPSASSSSRSTAMGSASTPRPRSSSGHRGRQRAI